MQAAAIVLAAGRGRRMGQDKALLELGGSTAVERVVRSCARAGAAVTIVRCAADVALPPAVVEGVTVVAIPRRGEMIDSVRAGLRARPVRAKVIVVFPVDFALVGADVVTALIEALGSPGARIALPLWQGRPGHPIALSAALEAEVLDPATTSLRAVVAREPARVRAIPVATPWVRRDLDTPDDLAAARAWLAGAAAETIDREAKP